MENVWIYPVILKVLFNDLKFWENENFLLPQILKILKNNFQMHVY